MKKKKNNDWFLFMSIDKVIFYSLRANMAFKIIISVVLDKF